MTEPFPISAIRAIPFHFLRRIGNAAVTVHCRYQGGGVGRT